MKRCCALLSLALCLSLAHLALAQTPSQVASALPHLVRFGGTVKDLNGNPITGMVGITFALYSEQTGGAPLWLETQNVTADSSGHYTVLLGSTSGQGLPEGIFASEQAHWVGVQASGQAEQPRVLLVSVPYAMKAADAATIGGLPPSAFVLAGASNGNSPNASPDTTNSNSPSGPNVGGSGTQDYIPLWIDNNGDLGNSVLFQSGSGNTAEVGINTTTPAATLDVNGGVIARGPLQLPSTGTATATQGYNSQPMAMTSSVFSSAAGTAVPQNFQWQAEPVNNDQSTASGTLNLLFATGSNAPHETGLNIASTGLINFASGQTFPGTLTGITAGTGITVTGSKTNPTVGINTTFANEFYAQLGAANTFTKSQTVNGTMTATTFSGNGSGLTNVNASQLGGLSSSAFAQLAAANTFTANQTVNGTVTAVQLISTEAQGTAPLQVTSTTQVPNLNATLLGGLSASAFQPAGSYATLGANSFTGNQGVTGTVTASGTVSGSSFQIGSNLFDAGSYSNENVFLGFAGSSNSSNGGRSNTAGGYQALFNSTGSYNTAHGAGALFSNTSASFNTAVGYNALYNNTTGSTNTAFGYQALAPNATGFNNTAIGYQAGPNTANLSYTTAIGANATVTESNAMVLGGTGAAAVNVGVGTTAPAYPLDVAGIIRTSSGGVKFPDGTLQTTAGGAGTITSVIAGTDLTGGGSSGSVTLNLDTTKVPQLASANAFTANQSVTGNVTASGQVQGGVVDATTSFDIGGTPFAFGNSTLGNAFLGFAGNTTTTGITNVATGPQAFIRNTSGTGNTASGFQALYANTTGKYNTAVGYAAGPDSKSTNLTNSTAIGANSVVSESNALVLGGTGQNAVNVGIGTPTPGYPLDVVGAINSSAGFDLGGMAFAIGSAFYYNAFLGGAGNSTTAGYDDTGSGFYALYANTGGSYNTANGAFALQFNTTGSNNTALGTNALIGNQAGSSNTAIGSETLSEILEGSNNTALGFQAGTNLDYSNSAAIGAYAQAAAANAMVLGGISGTNGCTMANSCASVNVGIGTTTPNPSAALDVVGYGPSASLGVGWDGIEALGGTPISNGDPGYGGTGVTGTGGNGTVLGNFGSDGPGGVFTGGNTSSAGDGIYAVTGSGFAGDFYGNVLVEGNLSKMGGSFKIDHPLDPANKYLYHSFVESPDMKNIYDGIATLNANGEATVELPEWFGALNRDFRYQLTCIGGFAPVYVAAKISNNRFEIAGGKPGLEVSWQVTGIRQDPWANAHRIPVEEEKEPRLRGYYIRPELYGAPEEKQIEWARHPQIMKKIQETRAKQLAAAQGSIPMTDTEMRPRAVPTRLKNIKPPALPAPLLKPGAALKQEGQPK